MTRFYEIKAFSVVGYVSLIVFSLFAYFGGRILPIGFGLIVLPLIIVIILSIYYIKLSIENKQVHFLCFSVIIFIMAFFVGINVDNYETKNIKNELINVEKIIEEYKFNNNIEYLTENDIENIIVPENMNIELNGKTFRIYFRRGIYDSESNKVYFRPRP
jgi:hypothetical protein